MEFVEREQREVRGVKLEFDGCAPLMFLFFFYLLKKRFAWITWRKLSALVGPVVQMNLSNRVDGIATIRYLWNYQYSTTMNEYFIRLLLNVVY